VQVLPVLCIGGNYGQGVLYKKEWAHSADLGTAGAVPGTVDVHDIYVSTFLLDRLLKD
jgi:hypothetical protein